MCEEGCSCHISTPCDYCTSHCICEMCNKMVHNDYLDDSLICEDCKAKGSDS